jgi:amino acid transporter
MASAESASQTPRAAELFTRQASGLVKTAGASDVFIFNLGLISIGAAIATNHFFGPAFYPGASVFWATVLTTAGSAIFVAGFWFFTITFPRTGGNYVFLTRSIHPWPGFAISFVEACVTLIFGGLTALFFVTTALAPFFGTVGVVTGRAWWSETGAWMGTTQGIMICGSLAIAFAALLPATGLRRYFAFQKILFVVAIGGLLVGFVYLLTTSPSEFASRFQDRTGLTEVEVVAAAKSSGWTATDGYGLSETLKFMVWPLAWILAGLYSVGFASEIRRVGRSQFIGMVGAVVFAGVVVAAYAPAVNHTIGQNFLGALAWNSSSAPEASTQVAPYVPLLITLGSGSTIVGVIVGLSFVAWYLFLIPAQLLYGQRVMLAWSLDRLMPAKLGWVSPRFHSPLVAIAVSGVAAIAFLAWLVYGELGKLVFTEGITFVWCCVLAIGVVFPWLKPEFFRRSPASAYRIGQIPLMSVVCALGLAFGCFILYLQLNDPLAAGHSKNALLPNIALLVAGFLIYPIAAAIRRAQGVDLNLVYRELPID